MYLNKGSSNSLFGRLGYIFSLLLLIGILHQNVALGSPLTKREDIEPNDPNSDFDNPDGGGSPFLPTEDKYPDIDECRKKVSVAKDKSVFYSAVGKHEEKPQEFADQLPDGVLLREAYPAGFTDKDDSSTGYKKFLERASLAFAEKSSGVVHVLLPTDGTDISKKVWTKIEKDALTGNGNVVTILKVDPDNFSKKCVLWGDADDNFASCDKENGPVPGKEGTSSGPNYTPGWCGVHVTQYQKENPSDPSSHYDFDVTLFDGAQKEIGKVTNQDGAEGKGVGVTSALPWVFIVTARAVDEDPVWFNYSDQNWGSNDQERSCNFGSYDNGKREGDCGFSC